MIDSNSDTVTIIIHLIEEIKSNDNNMGNVENAGWIVGGLGLISGLEDKNEEEATVLVQDVLITLDRLRLLLPR